MFGSTSAIKPGSASAYPLCYGSIPNRVSFEAKKSIHFLGVEQYDANTQEPYPTIPFNLSAKFQKGTDTVPVPKTVALFSPTFGNHLEKYSSTFFTHVDPHQLVGWWLKTPGVLE